MKHNKIITGLLATALVISAASCRKDDDTPPPPPPATTGSVKMEFNNRAGNEPLVLNTWYKTASGDSIKPDMFKYYISNITLNGGTSFSETESYHLIDQSVSSSKNFSIANVPNGSYNSVTFTIGVDSLRNVSGAQTGALDPANDMFWTWNTGYIMMKMEGISPKSTANGNKVIMHIGGFKGDYNAVRTVTLNFPQTLTVNGNEPHAHIHADLLKMFEPNAVDFAANSTLMAPSPITKGVADNYANMFRVDVVE